MYLTDKTVEKVFKGNSGESQGQNGAFTWTRYDVYFSGNDKKYSYFVSGKKPIPNKGMVLLYAEIVEKASEKDGKSYTNLTLKDEKWNEEIKQASGSTSNPSRGASHLEEKKAYIDHGKVMVDIIQMATGERNKVMELVSIFNEGIELMLNPKSNPIQRPKQVGGHAPDDFDSSDIPLDQIPF